MPDPKHISVDDALDEGVYGTVHDTIDNDAYTVSGQGPETAKREREQLHELRHSQRVGSGDEGDDASQQQSAPSPAPAPKPSKTSSASSGAGGSS